MAKSKLKKPSWDTKFQQLSFSCSTRVDGNMNHIPPTAHIVCSYREALKDDKQGALAFRKDPAVTFAAAFRSYFGSQEAADEWVNTNASEKKPHRVAFEGIGKQEQFLTASEKVRLVRQQLSDAGVDLTDEKSVREFLGLS